MKFCVNYQKGQYNPADYLSLNALNWDLLTKFEKKKSDDLANLLYMLPQ